MQREVFHNAYSLLIYLFFLYTVIYMKAEKGKVLWQNSQGVFEEPKEILSGWIYSFCN